MRVDAFDFELPNDRIALRPARPRDAARLMVVRPGDGIEDRLVRDLPDLLQPGDALVFNDTRVIPAQLEGMHCAAQARIGATLHKRIDLRRWQAFIRNGKRLKAGDLIEFSRWDIDRWPRAHDERARWPLPATSRSIVARAGTMRRCRHRRRRDGALLDALPRTAPPAPGPAAALHFTPESAAQRLKARGIGLPFRSPCMSAPARSCR